MSEQNHEALRPRLQPTDEQIGLLELIAFDNARIREMQRGCSIRVKEAQAGHSYFTGLSEAGRRELDKRLEEIRSEVEALPD